MHTVSFKLIKPQPLASKSRVQSPNMIIMENSYENFRSFYFSEWKKNLSQNNFSFEITTNKDNNSNNNN